ncbi:PQQ-binding-like beta-propeller repeat protein [Nannocystaceae bacterium ST9]
MISRTMEPLAIFALLTACPAPRQIEVEPVEQAEPVVFGTAPVEAEPARELPAIVAAPLPELAPTRPLANLAPLWRVETEGPPPSTVVAVGTTPLAMHPTDARALGLPDASVDLASFESPQLFPIVWAGSMLVLGSGTSFAGAVTTSQLAWLTPSHASYTSAISPRMLIASIYGSQDDRLIAWALADGREQWQRPGNAEFKRVQKLWIDDARGYLLGDLGLVVFDADTGATLWTSALAMRECGVASEGRVVVLEDPAGHRILDAQTGEAIARLPATGMASCGWEAYDDGVAPATILDGTLLAFDDADAALTLRAHDLATQAQRWQATGFDAEVLAADHDAVYVGRGRSLIALDAATGKQQAAIAIGSEFSLSVEPVGGAAGPLVVILDDWGDWVLGRAETAPAPESFVISGRLAATGGMDPQRIAGMRLRIGDQIVQTDKRGRFRAEGEAIGAIVIEPAANPYTNDYDADVDGYPPILIDGRQVTLEGKRSYELGTIAAFEAPIA